MSKRCTAVLTEDDQARADRYHFSRDRERFRVARGGLRLVLASLLGCEPTALHFLSGPYGKPFLADDALQFNLSHARAWLLIAVARGRRVGVDVEPIRPLRDLDALAERSFAPSELAELQNLPSAQRERTFFDIWTRKEAFVKATGEGIRALGTFAVSVSGPPRLHSSRDTGLDWTLLDLRDIPGHAACLAGEGRDWHLIQRSTLP